MDTTTIAFIGGGNMASSLIAGLLANGHPPDSIWVADVDTARLRAHQDRYAVRTSSDNSSAVSRADTVLLAVKPQVMREVVEGVKDAVEERNPLVISIAAGVREPDIRRWLDHDAAIVRCMPNTPALLRQGVTALYANALVSATQRSAAESVLRAAGATLWVEDEALLDAVTAVSGSGPAYYFLLMEFMEKAGVALGLEPQAARMLTLHTALGAARMAMETEESPAQLRARVTSPGGTTERAVDSFVRGGLERQVLEALTAARDRSRELGKLTEER